nr:MAG TPA: hypothetical protein [Caudoviricetes sp.]
MVCYTKSTNESLLGQLRGPRLENRAVFMDMR